MQQQVKQVIIWEPKRAADLTPQGKPTKREFVGKFRTKVPQGTPNAQRHTGENQAGRKWDFWGLDVDSVSGVVRWIDVRTTDFGPKIVLFLETDKRLNQITFDYDVTILHDIMNAFLGLGKDLATAHINVSYWIRKKTNKDGTIKTDKDGKPLWARNITFRDVPNRFTFDEWKAFAAENGLEWVQTEKNFKKEWNTDAECAFWMEKLVAVQRFLLKTETCLPFTWNSVTACETGALKDLLPQINSVYDSIKPLYLFPFGGSRTTSENVEFAPPAGYDATNQAHAANPFDTSGEAFPTTDLTDHEKGAEPGDDSDLPF